MTATAMAPARTPQVCITERVALNGSIRVNRLTSAGGRPLRRPSSRNSSPLLRRFGFVTAKPLMSDLLYVYVNGNLSGPSSQLGPDTQEGPKE